jgi:hypothetical protein
MLCKGTNLLYFTSCISLIVRYKLEYHHIQRCRGLEFFNVLWVICKLQESGSDLCKDAVIELAFGGLQNTPKVSNITRGLRTDILNWYLSSIRRLPSNRASYRLLYKSVRWLKWRGGTPRMHERIRNKFYGIVRQNKVTSNLHGRTSKYR